MSVLLAGSIDMYCTIVSDLCLVLGGSDGAGTMNAAKLVLSSRISTHGDIDSIMFR